MILVCGVREDAPLAMVLHELDRLGVDYLFLDQHSVGACRLEWGVARGALEGRLWIQDNSWDLEAFTAVYIRLQHHDSLPEVAKEPPDSPLRRHAAQLHAALHTCLQLMAAQVVNCEEGLISSNASKPYQALIIRREGFHIPDTLVSTDPDAVRAFWASHGRVIYKSVGGTRSIVQELRPEEAARLEKVRVCPAQFQELIRGTDVRVHTIGADVFGTAIHSEATDYRYALRSVGRPADLSAIDLAPDLAERCLRLAAAFGLAFAGIDLRLTPDGLAYCFEVNPMPAFSYYEQHTGQPIASAVARYLRDAAAGARGG